MGYTQHWGRNRWEAAVWGRTTTKKSIAATQNAKAIYESDNNSIFQRKPACILKIIK